VVEYRLDNAGFRVATAPRQHGRSRCEVAAFGDSNVFGYGVAAEAAFPAQLEDLLRAGEADVDVSNAGIAGTTLAQQRQWLEEVLARRAPDVVVLAVSPWSLRRDVPPSASAARTAGEKLWRLVNRWTGLLAERSAVADRIRRRVFHLLAERIGWPPSSDVAEQLESLVEPRPLFMRRFAAAASEIKQIAERLRTQGTAFVLVLVPLDIQLSQDRNRLYRAERLPYPAYGFQERDYTRDVRFSAAMMELAQALGLRTVDVTSGLATAVEDNFLCDDYHLSENGHRRIAGEIAPAVRGACERTVEAASPHERDSARGSTHGTELVGIASRRRGGDTRLE
jgi:lysophospholipase L1-like esterase